MLVVCTPKNVSVAAAPSLRVWIPLGADDFFCSLQKIFLLHFYFIHIVDNFFSSRKMQGGNEESKARSVGGSLFGLPSFVQSTMRKDLPLRHARGPLITSE